MSALDGFNGNLTPDIVDINFPLQEPEGTAKKVKQLITDGKQHEAELLFQGLHSIDQSTIEELADQVCIEAELSPDNLNILRAVRLGVRAGLQRGRQEGAQIIREIRSQGEVYNGDSRED